MREETIVLVDDIDGSEPAKKVSFGIDGVSYEIDLCEANEDRFRKVLAEFIPVARKQPKKPRSATAKIARRKVAPPTEE
jgi:hypothetical protein